jgi:hypothetical protein
LRRWYRYKRRNHFRLKLRDAVAAQTGDNRVWTESVFPLVEGANGDARAHERAVVNSKDSRGADDILYVEELNDAPRGIRNVQTPHVFHKLRVLQRVGALQVGRTWVIACATARRICSGSSVPTTMRTTRRHFHRVMSTHDTRFSSRNTCVGRRVVTVATTFTKCGALNAATFNVNKRTILLLVAKKLVLLAYRNFHTHFSKSPVPAHSSAQNPKKKIFFVTSWCCRERRTRR